MKKKIVDFIIENFVDSAYCVGYRIGEGDLWKEEKSSFKTIKPSIRYWYADPIPYIFSGKKYIFVEQFDRFRRIGYIGLTKMKKNGRFDRPKVILRGSTHMSFPMIMEYKGEYYMFPEVSESGRIDIYHMGNSPWEWSLYHSFNMEEKIVDIAYQINGEKIILIAGIENENNPLLVKRQLICLENLDCREKISCCITYTDKEYSLKERNGGSIYGKYRVVQESTASDYGMYVRLNEILELDAENICEREFKIRSVNNISVNLNKFLYRKIGIHTYGKCEGDFEVIDIAVTKFSFHPILRKMRGNKI